MGVKEGEEIIEEEWMTDEIRTNIKKRRELNRKKRNSKNETEKDKMEREW